MSTELALSPLDDLVYAGFQQQFQKTFGCPNAYTNVHERTKIIERMFGGKAVTYPYATVVIQNIGAPTDTYNAHSLGRRGLVMGVPTGGGLQTVKVLPVNIDLEIQYVTNKFQSRDQGSVTAFLRRWMMARRFGYLKYQVTYGRLLFGIHVTLPDSIGVPIRENIVEQETSYICTATATIHGYVSEPILGQQGKVEHIDLDNHLAPQFNDTGSAQWFPFDRT